MKEMKLNLCCGADYRENWINLDIGDKDIYGNNIKVDVKHDITKFPWPFEDETFDLIYIHNSLEHFEKHMVPKIVDEMLRITKKGKIVNIIVPHFTNYVNPRDLTHLTPFCYETITTSCHSKYMGNVDTKMILTNNRIFKFLNYLMFNKKVIKYYERFFCYIIVPQELNIRITRK